LARKRSRQTKHEREAAIARNREFLRAYKPRDPNALGRLRPQYIAECLKLRSGVLTYCEYAIPPEYREPLRTLYFKGLSDADLTEMVKWLRQLWKEYGQEGMDMK